MSIAQERWMSVLQQYYLSGYISDGGSAFKMALTGDEETPAEVLNMLRNIAGFEQCFYVQVSAEKTRIDRIEQIFHEIARQVDWAALSVREAERLLSEAGYRTIPNAQDIDVSAIASFNESSVEEMSGDIRRTIKNKVLSDHSVCKDFRTAIAKLCGARFFPKTLTPSDTDTIIGWLCGQNVSLKALRELGIYSRISRQNARDMLKALSLWLGSEFCRPLVIGLDLSQLVVEKRKGLPTDEDVIYSRNNCLDAFEVLRQFIDDTDDTSYCLICGVGTSELETSAKRSIFGYYALQSRLTNEVHDQKRPNLLAPMVRLGVKNGEAFGYE